MSLTLRQIRYFIAAAENGKVSDAAAAIAISPSAITSAIQELESILGVTLFDRHYKGLKLTYEGGRFLQQCQNILEAVAAATDSISQSHSRFSGKLRVGVTITVSSYFLPPLYARFRRAFPNIDIELVEKSRTVIERKLLNQELDIAVLLVSNLNHKEQLESETLVRSRRRLWAAPNHPLLAKSKISIKDIAKEPYIQLMIDEANRTHREFWKQFNCRPSHLFETESVEAVRSMVASGAGVTILSDMVYRPWSLEGDRIEVRDLLEDIPSMDVGLAWHHASEASEIITAFIEYCRMEYTSGRRSIP